MRLAAGLLWLSVVLGTFAVGPASAALQVSSASPIEAVVLARTAEFSRTIVEASKHGWSRESVARIADFYAVDTVVFPPRGGDLATEWGTLRLVTRQDATPPVKGAATYVSIWTKRDGIWRKQMDTWW